MAFNSEQIRHAAEIGAKVIELQLSVAHRIADDAFCHRWAIGYCYGVFEALGQHGGMDMVETAALVTVGFQELLPEADAKKKYVRAFELRTEAIFAEGRAHGVDDLLKFVSDSDFRPLTLTNYFTLGKPAAL